MTKVTRSTLADSPCPTVLRSSSKGIGSKMGHHKPRKQRDEIRGRQAKSQKWDGQHTEAARDNGKLFGFAIGLVSHHQAKPKKIGNLLTDLLSQSRF